MSSLLRKHAVLFPSLLLLNLVIAGSSTRAQEKCTQVPAENPQNRKIVISDLHLGAGRQPNGAWSPLEDFRFPVVFRNFLEQIGQRGNTDLIIAGDFIDFWQILPETDERRSHKLGSSEQESLAKLEVALKQHRGTFGDLQRFASTGKNRLIIVPGNHDVDLFWPQVQTRLQRELALPLNQKLFFTNSCYESQGVHVEHGHQQDEANSFKSKDAPFVTDDNSVRRLETNWGTVFMSRFYNQVEIERPFVDNLTPELAGILWALRSESPARFSLRQIGRLLVMLVFDQNALAQLELFVHKLGDEEPPKKIPPKTVDNLLKLYQGADPELAKVLQATVESEEGRREAENALKDVTPEQWAALQAGFERVAPNETLENQIRQQDPYIQEARRIVIQRPDIRIVVMAHTHELDRDVVSLDELGMPDRWYVNTGCWQKVLKVNTAKASRKWNELNLDDAIFPLRFSYIVVNYQENTPIRPVRSFWIEVP